MPLLNVQSFPETINKSQVNETVQGMTGFSKTIRPSYGGMYSYMTYTLDSTENEVSKYDTTIFCKLFEVKIRYLILYYLVDYEVLYFKINFIMSNRVTIIFIIDSTSISQSWLIMVSF